MNRLLLSLVPLAAGSLAGCEKDLVADQPDAGIDATPLPPGNFSCAGVDWPTSVRDPFPINGKAADWNLAPLSGVTAEVYDVDTNGLLGSDTSSTGGLEPGRWSVSIPTGGTARKIYRKTTFAGYLDTYAYDAFAEFQDFRWGTYQAKQSDLDGYYNAVGMTADPSKGIIAIEAWDCWPPGTAQIKATEGATFEAPPGSRVIYWDSTGNPDPTLTATSATWAGALILGVAPGLTDIVVHAGPLTYRSWPIEVRANALTITPRHP